MADVHIVLVLFLILWISLLVFHVATVVAAIAQPWLVKHQSTRGNGSIRIVVPLCGVDSELALNLESVVSQNYPNFSVEFAVARDDDLSVHIAQQALARAPAGLVNIRVGENAEFLNRKASNEYKCLVAANTEYVCIVDSNVDLPRDALLQLSACMTQGTGLIAALPVGVRPTNIVGYIEAAFLNGFGARLQLAGAAFGVHRVTGKCMFLRWSEELLKSIRTHFQHLRSEDIAVFRAVRSIGLEVKIADFTVQHPLGSRAWSEFWGRQVRWAGYRITYFPLVFLGELSTSLWTLIGVGVGAAIALDLPVSPVFFTAAGIWYGTEVLLHIAKRWPLSARLIVCWPVRDVLFMGIWLQAMCRLPVTWRGVHLDMRRRI